MWYPAIQAMLGKLYVLSLYYTLYAFSFGNPFVGFFCHCSVCLINAFWGHRNNRMDLSNEPPVTYVTTRGASSLDSMGSPTRRYVLSLPFPDQEQSC